jgi:Conjugative transposon protein TcpC
MVRMPDRDDGTQSSAYAAANAQLGRPQSWRGLPQRNQPPVAGAGSYPGAPGAAQYPGAAGAVPHPGAPGAARYRDSAGVAPFPGGPASAAPVPGGSAGAAPFPGGPGDGAPSTMARGAHAAQYPRAAGVPYSVPADEGPRKQSPTFGGWSGAGGRWILWPLRALLWAALLIVVYRGITAIFVEQTPRTTTAPNSSAGSASSQFPVTLAEAYALEFGQVYLNFTPATQATREQELAAFVSPSLAAASPDLGWNGSGQEHLQSEQVAGITVQDAQHAVVNLLATVSGQLMELGVPVYAAGDDVVVSGTPAWLGAPPPISAPSAGPVTSDQAVAGQLMNQLPAFFQAYASGDATALKRFLAPGVTLTGLDGSVTFDAITNLLVPSGGSTRHATVTVVWQVLGQDGLTGAKLTMTYGVSVVDLQSGKWYVKGVGASTEAVGGQ